MRCSRRWPRSRRRTSPRRTASSGSSSPTIRTTSRPALSRRSSPTTDRAAHLRVAPTRGARSRLAASNAPPRRCGKVPHVRRVLGPGCRGTGSARRDAGRAAQARGRYDVLREAGADAPGFLSIAVDLDVNGSDQRDKALAGIDQALGARSPGRSGALVRLMRRLDRRSIRPCLREVLPVLRRADRGRGAALYRSIRTLFAFLLTLSAAVALAVAAGGLLGYTFTIVSVLVPLTILVTTLSTLVYLHSRFVERPTRRPELEEPAIRLSRNKLLP